MKMCCKICAATVLGFVLLLGSAKASAQVVRLDPETGAFTAAPEDPPVQDPTAAIPPESLQTLDTATEQAVEFESPVAGGGVGVSVQGGFLHFMKTSAQAAGPLTAGCTPRAMPQEATGVCVMRRGPVAGKRP